MTEPVKDDADRLMVRVRKSYGGGGEVTERHFVHCSRQGKAMDLEDCLTCEYCKGAYFDPKDDKYFLSCQPWPKNDVERIERPATRSKTAADQTSVGSIMTADVHCVTADLSVEALTILLLEKNIGGAPVIDAEGRPIGMVTKTDLVEARNDAGDDLERAPLKLRTRQGLEVDLGPGFHAERIARATVGEIMTPLAFHVRESASVAEVAALMVFEGLHRVPVISEERKVVGIVSSLDVLAFVARESGYLRPKA